MEFIRQQADFADRHGLFKAGSAWDVLKILVSGRASVCQVSKVDVFISHTWSCPSWKKILAICYELNLDLALGLSVSSCLSAVVSMAFYAGSLGAVAEKCQDWLLATLFYLPMLVFVVAFFFGHAFHRSTFWMDRLSINQLNMFEKARALQALPAFVAHSGQMLAVWDDRYFERLWCIYELAVSAKTTSSKLKVVPIWAPVFTLSGLAVSFFLACNYNQETPNMDVNSRQGLFEAWFSYTFVPAPLLLLPSLAVSWFCFEKLHGHKQMLEQMASFDLKNAQCTLETDRVVIERQVLELFDEALEAPLSVSLDAPEDVWSDAKPLVSQEAMSSIRHLTSYPSKDQVIEHFNDYVRGPLRDRVLTCRGREVDISFKSCAVCTLPVWYVGLVMLLGCDGHGDCERGAAAMGYQSVMRYMLTNVVINLVIGPLSFVLIFPLALRSHSCLHTESQLLRWTLGSVCSFSVLLFTNLLQAVGIGSAAVVVNKGSKLWLTSFTLGFLLTALAAYGLFLPNKRRSSRRLMVDA